MSRVQIFDTSALSITGRSSQSHNRQRRTRPFHKSSERKRQDRKLQVRRSLDPTNQVAAFAFVAAASVVGFEEGWPAWAARRKSPANCPSRAKFQAALAEYPSLVSLAAPAVLVAASVVAESGLFVAAAEERVAEVGDSSNLGPRPG